MLISIDGSSSEPLYAQIHDQIVRSIALGELTPGMQLPSVRSLASDLGINLHTVNKAYAVLRDEGYVRMAGRSGAFIAELDAGEQADREARATSELEEALFQAALSFRAKGGSCGAFLETAAAQAAVAFGVVANNESPKSADVSQETTTRPNMLIDSAGSTFLRKRHFGRA